MKYKLILLFSALLIINAGQAQWHFTAKIDYYCNGENHDLEVYQWQIQLAQQLSATAFNTKQDCEAARQSVNIFVGVSECWVRITPSPCTGNDVGGGVGGGIGGNLGIGGSSQGSTSPHNSIAIGDSYFAPTGTQVIANTGQELEIKLEAMSKSFNNAMNGVKTGDQSFDEIYKRQTKEIPKSSNEENIGPYTFKSRNEIDPEKPLYVNINNLETVNLGKENEYVYENDDIIVPIDIERFNNLEQEALWAKPFNKRFPKDEEGVISSLYDFSSSSYKVGSGFIKDGIDKANNAINYLEKEYDTKVPYSEKIGEFEEYCEQADVGMKVAGKAFVGDIVGATAEFVNEARKKAKDEVIDPLIDKAFNTANTLANKYSHTKDLLSTVGNPLKKTTTGTANTIFKGISHAEKTGDPSYLDKTMNKEISKYSREITKWTENYLYKK